MWAPLIVSRSTASLAGIEEKSLGALLIGDSRPIVGRQSRQHFRLQGGKSREVRGLRCRYDLLSRYFQTISLFHRAASHNPIQARLAARRIPAIRNPRPPILSARRIATRFASPSWCRGAAPSGSPIPRNDRDQRLARLDAPRKYTFRHLPPFVICEDANVRDDWIVEPNPYCFKISTSAAVGALGARHPDGICCTSHPAALQVAKMS